MTVVVNKEKIEETDKTIKNHVFGAVGVGFIPVPVVDLIALTGIQINMLRKLSNAYEIPFSQDKVKNLIASLVGGGFPLAFSPIVYSLIKLIPIIGSTTSAITMPILAGATTYAVGKVFSQHFASGGTFLDFDPEKVRDYYNQMFQEGQDIASKAKEKSA